MSRKVSPKHENFRKKINATIDKIRQENINENSINNNNNNNKINNNKLIDKMPKYLTPNSRSSEKTNT